MSGLRRVVVTGMGVVSSLGNCLDTFSQHLFSGHSGIALCQRHGPEWPQKGDAPFEFLVGQAQKPVLEDLPPHLSPQLLDDFSVFALSAANQAVQHAGLPPLKEQGARTAVVMGSGIGGDTARNLGTYRAYVLDRKPHPYTVVRAMANAAASAISVVHGITGPTFSINSACASAGHAIAQGRAMIRAGMADVVLAGGSETLPSYSLYRAWQSMRVLSQNGCHPFATERNGMVLGEGAGVVVLESYEAARQRGATVYAEITGCGINADATDMVQPNTQRMAEAMKAALDEGGHLPAEVDHINAHGTGTKLNDLAEAKAIHQLLGNRTSDVPVSACKSLLGHTIGAAGALECIATVLTLFHGCAPPTLMGQIDPDCALFQPQKAIHRDFTLALSNSFAFGGLNAVLALSRIDRKELS